MRIVHITTTPLAGAPIRLVQAQQKYAGLNARLINLDPLAYGQRTFDEDMSWVAHNEEAKDLIRNADILHFHHTWFPVNSINNPFGVNFRKLVSKNCKFIFQHHSAPRNLSINFDDRPLMVIPHYPERYFPTARVVPNIIDLDTSTHYISSSKVEVVFAPSIIDISAWSHRWHTKAAPETIKILKKIKRENDFFGYEIITNKPYHESIRAKSLADVIVEETVTGSYHQGGLEGIALGKAVICHLDDRSRYILSNITGTNKSPFLDCRIEDLHISLVELVKDKKSLEMIGAEGRRWFELYYNPSSLIKFYVDAYEDLLVSEAFYKEKSKLGRLKDFDSGYGAFTIRNSQMMWELRKSRYSSSSQKMLDLLSATKKRVSSLKKRVKKCFIA